MKITKYLFIWGLLSLVTLLNPSLSQASTIGSVEFKATDLVVPVSSAVQNVSVEVILEVHDAEIDAAIFGFLLDISPASSGVKFTGGSIYSGALDFIFPIEDSFFDAGLPQPPPEEGTRIASSGGYFLFGDVQLSVGSYGLAIIDLEIAPNTTGTFDFDIRTFTPDSTEHFSGVASSDAFFYPVINADNSSIGQLTIVPEPSSIALLLIGGVGLVLRFRKRGVKTAA